MMNIADNPHLHKTTVSRSTLFWADCFDVFPLIADKSVDAIIADLPYGTTACKWDSILPLDKLWSEYNRIIKTDGAILLTASQPFTTTLISSNLKGFKYCWYWDKLNAGSFATAKYKPLSVFEDVCIFSKNGGKTKYFPIMEQYTYLLMEYFIVILLITVINLKTLSLHQKNFLL